VLVKMVFRTARECQPSVILIDECEKVRLPSARRCSSPEPRPRALARACCLGQYHASQRTVLRRRCK
jgi:ATP-dependent 26S proteasome regulatory subunit